MNPTRLLRELESLPHDARVRRMVELGRLAKSDASVAAAITLFERGGFYERWLALNSCYGSRDGAQVLRALADPSQAIRGAALKLAALSCDDAQESAALATISPDQQSRLLKLLAVRRRHTPIDTFLAGLDEERLPQLVSYGSDALVALARSPRSWDAERLARLQIYRADPAALVAAAAQFTFPPD
jgi:hypothetical protein